MKQPKRSLWQKGAEILASMHTSSGLANSMSITIHLLKLVSVTGGEYTHKLGLGIFATQHPMLIKAGVSNWGAHLHATGTAIFDTQHLMLVEAGIDTRVHTCMQLELASLMKSLHKWCMIGRSRVERLVVTWELASRMKPMHKWCMTGRSREERLLATMVVVLLESRKSKQYYFPQR